MLARQIKAHLRAGAPSIGSWVSLGHTSIAEMLGAAGFDWVVVDTEHTAIDNAETLRLIMAIERGGAVPLVRLASIDPVQTKVVLDSGAAGVIAPMVNTRADAVRLVQAVKYPPTGTRGVGLARAHRYGPGFNDYVTHANDDTLVIAQIEHRDGVENIEDILDVPGIDGTFIGPYDLSMSLGLAGQLDHPAVVSAQARVLAATRRRHLAAGIHLVHPDRATTDLPHRLSEGYQFIALSSDLLLLGDAARSLGRLAQSARAGA